MSRAIRPALGIVVLIPFVCFAAVGTAQCPRNPGCAGAGPLMQAMGVGSRVLEAAIVALAIIIVLRLALTLRSSASAYARLSILPVPASLRAAQLRTGTRRLRCVASAPLPAFCKGGFRPVILITAATVQSLSGTALEAVLLHEETHRRRRDPLRRALRMALSDIAPWSRLLVSYHARAVIREELRADATAARRLGGPAVARALLAMAPNASDASTVPGFGDAAEPRVAQLLGDDVQLPPFPVNSAVRTAAASAAVLAVLLCTLPGAI
jgi:hypothetical protein